MSVASDRLARSRLALIEQVQGKERQHESKGERQEREQSGESGPGQSDTGRNGSHWFDTVKAMAGSWWRQHPAHVGLELATPLLSAYAAKKPVQFLGIAAALGAVVVVVRPWRLITAGGVLAALLKSNQISSMVMSAMSAADFRKDAPPYK